MIRCIWDVHSFCSLAFYGAGSELICMQPPTDQQAIWESWLGNLRELQLSTMPPSCGWWLGTKEREGESRVRRVVRVAGNIPQIACSLFMAANVSSFGRHKFVMQATGSGPTDSGNNSPQLWFLFPRILLHWPTKRSHLHVPCDSFDWRNIHRSSFDFMRPRVDNTSAKFIELIKSIIISDMWVLGTEHAVSKTNTCTLCSVLNAYEMLIPAACSVWDQRAPSP